MRLKNRNLAPVGGYYYLYDLVKDGKTYPVRVTSSDGGLAKLAERVRADMKVNGVAIPENLEVLIEEQICSRQPAEYVWKTNKGLGDMVAGGIQAFAGVADSVVQAVTGKSPELKKKQKAVRVAKKEKKPSTESDGDKLVIKGKKKAKKKA